MLARTFVSALMLLSVAIASGPTEPASIGARDAIRLLQTGNRRFVNGETANRHRDEARRQEIAKGQAPFAAIVTCSDSRVVPEFIFDQGLGDLFVVRVAGNTLDPVAIGSVEYAVEHLGTKLVVVMGHRRCGAVGAALHGGHLPGSLPHVVEPIEESVKAAKSLPGDHQDNATILNVRRMARVMTNRSEIVRGFVLKGKVVVVPMYYDLDTGVASQAQGDSVTVYSP